MEEHLRDSLKMHLESLTTQGREGLFNLVKIAGLKPASRLKEDLVQALHVYLGDEANILAIWHGLSPCDRELLELFIRNEQSVDRSEIEEVMQKHGIQETPYYRYYSLQDVFEQNSRARLFFSQSEGLYPPIRAILLKLIKPIEANYTAIEHIDDLTGQVILTEESFGHDIVQVLMLANQTNLRVTEASGMPTKASVIKINSALGNKELLFEGETDLSDIRGVEQTTRIYGMIKLCFAAGLLKAHSGSMALGSGAEAFLEANSIDKCRMLYKAYLSESRLNELLRIRERKLKMERPWNIFQCRKLLADYLADCPLNQWVTIGELLHVIHMNDRNFLDKAVGSVLAYDSYDRQYYEGMLEWPGLEGRLIQVMLLEYFSVLGMVDIGIVELEDEYGQQYFEVSHLRLTELGGYILGVNDSYPDRYLHRQQPEQAELIVEPNFEIVITEGANKHVHQLFFDRFADRLADDTASIYELTFESMVRALDNGISVKEVLEYLAAHAGSGIPDHVQSALEDWHRQSSRIRIRQITVVETDDPDLLETLKGYKSIRRHMAGELSNSFEIGNDAATKVKREMEKKGHFCMIE